jgi:protein SCO1/2
VSPRTRLILLAVAAVALPVALLASFAARSDDSSPPAIVEDLDPGAQPPGGAFKGAARPLTPPADFSLRDQGGRLVRLRDLRGRVVVLSPMYTSCPDTCPLVAQQIRGALDDLPARERRAVSALALSVDPAHDTPAAARRFLRTHGVWRYLDFLVGPRSSLKPVWRAYGFAPQSSGREHNSYVVVIDKRGRQRVGFPVDYLTPEGLAHDIGVLARERPEAKRG